MKRFSIAQLDWYGSREQIIFVSVAWTLLSIIITLKLGITSPVSCMGAFSVWDHLIGWGVSLLFIPIAVYVIRKGVLGGHWIISLLSTIVLSVVISYVWTLTVTNEVVLPIENAKELKISSAEFYHWENKEARFIKGNTFDLFSSLLLIIGISFAVSIYQLLRLRERSESKLKERLFRLNLDLLEAQLKENKSDPFSQSTSSEIKKIPVKLGSKTYFLEQEQIAYIKASGNYLELFDLKKNHVIRGTMNGIMKKLPDHFIRIHKSSIVNTNFIEALISIGYGDFELKMKDGQHMRISDSYKQEVLKQIEL